MIGTALRRSFLVRLGSTVQDGEGPWTSSARKTWEGYSCTPLFQASPRRCSNLPKIRPKPRETQATLVFIWCFSLKPWAISSSLEALLQPKETPPRGQILLRSCQGLEKRSWSLYAPPWLGSSFRICPRATAVVHKGSSVTPTWKSVVWLSLEVFHQHVSGEKRGNKVEGAD